MAKGKSSSAPKIKTYVLLSQDGAVIESTRTCPRHWTKSVWAPLQAKHDSSQWVQRNGEGGCGHCIDELIEFEFSDSDYGEPESSI